MFVTLPLQKIVQGFEQPSTGFYPKIMVYDDAPAEPTPWEYNVLTVDTYKRSLPDAERLNELGREGWLLSGVLHQEPAGDVALVHYYFVRQLQDKGAKK